MKLNSICDVPGVKVGNARDKAAQTGCTVILLENGAVGGMDVRGSAPGTREIELLQAVRLVSEIHAILLTGGSAFGLDAAGGVMQFLEEHDIGYDTGVAKVPLVPSAVIFDLAVGDPAVRPDRAMGYEAARNANSQETAQGSVGAATGATVGKLAGPQHAMKGGLGTSSLQVNDKTVLGVLVVVNALGNIIDPETNKTIAGALDPHNGGFIDPHKFLLTAAQKSFADFSNTTLGVVATNAALTKEEATKVAQMANDGLARAINPAHTQYDGDIIFAISTGTAKRVEPLLLGTLAADLMARAIVQGVKIANGIV